MNTTLVNLSIKSGMALSVIASKYSINGEELVEFAKLIKGDEARSNEFIKTFVHRKKLSPKVRWDSLVALDKKEKVFEFIMINNDGKPEYEDEALLTYVIRRFVSFVGIPATYQNVLNGLQNNPENNKKFNFDVIAMYVMKYFVEEFEAFLYSEFANNFFGYGDMLLQAISVVEEVEEV